MEKQISARGGSAFGGKINRKINFKIHDFFLANFKLLMMLLVVAILFSGYFLLLKPKFTKIQNEIKSTNDLQIAYAGLEEKMSQLSKINQNFVNLSESDLEKINAVIPDIRTRDELLSQLESLVSRTGLLMTSLQLSDVGMEEIEGAGKIGKIKISMAIDGVDYASFKNFLGVIESNLRIIDITSLQFSPGSSNTSLEMIAYYK